MLKNAFLKTLRDYRWQIILWGTGLAILMAAQVQAYYNFFKGPDKEQMLADYRRRPSLSHSSSVRFMMWKPWAAISTSR